ncbi:hypothetical protein JCM5350_004964 [Sporobolomyces pararoseus]
MSPKLQRHVSKIFHRRISSPEKEEKESADSEEDESAPPKSPRSRPTFSLSSLSFRRQNVNTPSILTPPHTPPLISTTFSSSPSSGDDEEEEEEEEGENVLHIRNPPPSLHESEQSTSLVTNPTSYFDFSPSHFSHLHQELATDRFHAHTAPPSPLSTQNGPVLSSSRRRSNLLEPPISANRFEYFTSSSSSSSVSRVNAEDGGEEEPKSAFSDWGTSVGGGTESRNTSSEDLSESEDGRELLSAAEGTKGVSEGEGKEGKEEKGEKAQEVNEEKEEEDLKSSTPPDSRSPSTPNPADPIRRTSTPAVTPPRSSLENSPPPLPSSSHSHSQAHSRHHRHHNHHHHTSKLMAPKESRVAESSYPELAIAFFMSLKKFKGRKLDRRASTGSLGGAV